MQPPQQQQIQQTSNFRANGASNMQTIQNSFIVGNSNFPIFQKMGNNKVEQLNDNTRIIKNHETNNNQSQIKQRIIYEIASEVKTNLIIIPILLYFHIEFLIL